MLDPIINFFEKLVDQFTWRRLIFVISVVVIVVIGLWVFESYTAHFKFQRIEKATTLLDKLIAQHATVGTNSTAAITDIHENLVRDLDATVNSHGYPDWYLKAFCAAVPWMLLAFLMGMASKLEHNAVIGMLIFAIPIVIIGSFLPTFEHRWINYVGYPVIGCLVPTMLITKWQKRKAAPA